MGEAVLRESKSLRVEEFKSLRVEKDAKRKTPNAKPQTPNTEREMKTTPNIHYLCTRFTLISPNKKMGLNGRSCGK